MSRTLLTSKLNKQISARRTELRQTVGRGAHTNCTHVRVYSQQQFIWGVGERGFTVEKMRIWYYYISVNALILLGKH